jgi:nitrile hydratase
MDGIHDLGGRQGFGSLTPRDEETFHAPSEPRVHAIAGLLLAQGCFAVDAFRHAIERLDPVTYLTVGYYGRWLSAVENLVDEDGGRPRRGRVARSEAMRDIDRRPRFDVGDTVRTRALYRDGHCRLPGYARAKRGTVAILQGGWVLPDTNAHGRGENPQHVYAVRFEAQELWGETAEGNCAVHIDLFESYLEPA